MTWALRGVALLSRKVWHLVLWLAEHVGWGGTQSHPCSIGQFGVPWMTESSILPLRLIYADPHHYWSASIAINLPNSISNEAFSEPPTHFLPSLKPTVKQQTRLWRGSWTTIAWSMAHGMDTTLHGCSSLPESREFWLHTAFFGQNEIHATSSRSNVKSIT